MCEESAAAENILPPIDRLDWFYADALSCAPEDLSREGVTIISNPRIHEVRIAKSSPLALYAIGKAGTAVVSARPDLVPLLERVAREHPDARLDGPLCDLIEKRLADVLPDGRWFRGIRLYCRPSSFVDRSFGTVRPVTTDDETAIALHARWGGEVFGQIVDGRVVSWAAVKPFSNVEWDLRVDTLPEYRRRGYARSVVSAAVKHIFACGRLAGWGCDRLNRASLATARSVGFSDYGLDFGCVLGRVDDARS